MSGPDLHEVIPVGLLLDEVEISSTRIAMTVRSAMPAGCCPGCSGRSARLHSRYTRRLLALPSHGRTVELRVAVRRFHCPDRACPRQTFVERLDGRSAPGWARRTSRLEDLVHRLGIALGGRPAASPARRLMLPVSKDTLLRVVRGSAPATEPGAHIIGIDEWAWWRGQRYGTIICDLGRRRVIDLLPDREPATVKAWLSSYPGIRVLARDRAGGYAGAITAAAPLAVQVADRWHLMENASATYLQAVRSEMGPIRRAFGAGVVDPDLLSAAERLQHEGYLRRCEENSAMRAMASAGTAIKEIARRTGRSRKLVHAVLRMPTTKSSATARAAWRHGSSRSTRRGLPAAATVRISGGACAARASVAACGSSASGPRVGDEANKLTVPLLRGCRLRGSSPAPC
jgi:transposase